MDIEEAKGHQNHLLSDEVKYAIVFYKKEGKKSNNEIVRQIFQDFNRQISKSTVTNIWTKYEQTNQISNQWSSKGRPRMLGEEEVESLIETVKDNRLISSNQLVDSLKLNCCRETVNRELIERGYHAYRAPAKPLLTQDNIYERNQFALKHKFWTEERWRGIVFTDESPFRLVMPNGRLFVRRLEEEELELGTIQYCAPKSKMLMVWGAISCSGVGPLVWIKGTLRAKEYLDLFRYRLRKFYPGLYDGTLLFQDDNASVHTGTIVDEWFHKYSIQRIAWPAKSPDLNIIEDVWNKIKYEMRGKVFETQEELFKEVLYHWHHVSQEFIDHLYASLPARVEAVLEAQGGATKY